MIESYVNFLEKANDTISILIKIHFGGLRPHVHRPPKTAFNNSQPNAMKFDIEIVCIQEIVMDYMSLEFFL